MRAYKVVEMRFRMKIVGALVTCLGLSTLACTAATTDDATSEDELATTYVSADDFWKNAKDQDAWLAIKRDLVKQFDDVCGDTFCGGDYSNLTSMHLACGVSSVKGSIRDCVWTFTGSSHIVAGKIGTVQNSIASFQCHFKPSGTARGLLSTLGPAGKEPTLRRIVPGLGRSLYDVLGDCFQHPIDASPIAQDGGNTYVDALDATTTDQGKWIDGTRALEADFANACGDTWCAGDYEIASLKIACSVRDTTNTLRSCKWLLGGAYPLVDAKTGAVAVHTKAWRCTLPATGKANDLAGVWAASDAKGPLDRVLPGSTKSARDVLNSCF